MDAIKIIDGYIQLKHGTSTEWSTENPVLMAWELGIETDTNLGKIGDGVTSWNSLPYAFNGSCLPLSGGTMTGEIVRNGVLAKNSLNSNYVVIYGGTTSTAGARLGLRGSTYTSDPGSFLLNASNGTNQKALLGKPDGTLTWNGQAIQTSSDRRLKTEFADPDDKVLDVWGKIKWQQYKYIEDVNQKGSENCRIHFGLVAQDVQEVGEKEDVDLCRYGILCKGEHWFVRYEEALSLEAMYQRRRADNLEKRIAELERIIKEKGEG